ncbi:MAG: hypothetical protein HY517_00530 [Candidatus Aenigmarchaeota archaeon]|nr:hypothetical protein [Candidatus Aenigmarchaeota archaeon]
MSLLKSKQEKRIFYRLIEGLGIGLLAGAMIGFSLSNSLTLYYFVVGVAFTLIGAYKQEINNDRKTVYLKKGKIKLE